MTVHLLKAPFSSFSSDTKIRSLAQSCSGNGQERFRKQIIFIEFRFLSQDLISPRTLLQLNRAFNYFHNNIKSVAQMYFEKCSK